MATMYPAEWEDVNHSHAEHHIFRRLRHDTPDDWYAIHSVGLTTHSSKTWAEIDFVIVGPFGVLCLEVKGGRITVQDGRWATNGKPLRESPYSQAGGGAAALRKELRKKFPPVGRALVEYATAFPDSRLDTVGPGMDAEITYDERTVGVSMKTWVEHVADHWRQRRDLDSGRFRPLSRGERSAIASWLAPSFTAIPSLRARVADSEAEFVRLTKLQARVLRGMQSMPRALIRGGAGTGKTLLAVEEASRLAAEGRRVLLCCRSPHLADYLRTLCPEELIDVRDATGLMIDLLQAADRVGDLPDASPEDLFHLFMPERAATAAIDLEKDGSYNALVIDEAQDLLLEGLLDLFDVLLEDGLEGGTWRVFLDQKQNLFSSVDINQLKRLEDFAVSRQDLVDNCRNTPEIATMTALLSAAPADEPLAQPGPEVELRFFSSQSEEWPAVCALVQDWARQGISPGDIVVLGDDPQPPAHLTDALRRAGLNTSRLEDRDERNVTWGTVEDFKGLESQAVIVTNVNGLERREELRRVYVGCSRARTLLGILIAASAQETFNVRAGEWGRLHDPEAA